MLSVFGNKPVSEDKVDMSEFWRVWNLLEEKFVSSSTSTASLTNDERVQAAISGLVRSYGDPYTTYMPPQDAAAFNEDISGNFSGVGMEVGMRDNVITVSSGTCALSYYPAYE